MVEREPCEYVELDDSGDGGVLAAITALCNDDVDAVDDVSCMGEARDDDDSGL